MNEDLDVIKDLSDHDLLILVYARQSDMIKHFGNHVHHHNNLTLAALSAAFMGIASFIVGALLLMFGRGA